MVLKATESERFGPDTPGYVYEELIRLSFDGKSGANLATVLTSRLQATKAVESKLKTLKTIQQLALKGSREFRRSLRQSDEFLKNAAESGSDLTASTSSVPSGNVKLHQVRSIAADIRSFLFDQSTLDQDENHGPESMPQSELSGMGSSMKTAGKYEGFGSAPLKGTVIFLSKA